jgi:hypothetical protein
VNLMHTLRRRCRGLALVAALVTFAPVAHAQQPATAPATAPSTAPAGADVVVVTAVEGMARARTGPGADWQLAAVGMRLPVGAEISTGPRARVTCSIPPGEEFVVDRMSNVTVLEAERRGNRQRTRLIMEYGRTAARVQAAGIQHDMRIRTPATTASVRGTEYTVYDQPPFAPELRTYTGLVDYRFAKRQMLVGRGGRSQGGRGSAETALLESVVDPSTPRVRTAADAALIANETSRGAVVRYDQDIQLNEIRGGAGPQTDAQLARSLPGRLNFVLRWPSNADVDIFVTVQPGDQFDIILNGAFNPQTFLYPGFGMETSELGGRIAYNHRGGRNGGQEICFWTDAFPTAVYGFSALNNSSTSSADVKFNAFQDGQKISLYTFSEVDGSLIRTKGMRRTLAPDGVNSAIVLAPPNDLFESFLPESPDETLDGTVPPEAGGTPPPPEPLPPEPDPTNPTTGTGTTAPVAQAVKAKGSGRKDRGAAKVATAKAAKAAKSPKSPRPNVRPPQPQRVAPQVGPRKEIRRR